MRSEDSRGSVGRCFGVDLDGTRFPSHDNNCLNSIELAELEVFWSTPPLDITFDSEHRFHFHYHTHRIPYDVVASLHATNNLVVRGGRLRLVGRAQKERYCEEDYCLDGGHEWVVSGSQRVCWIPSGYIGSTEASHFWAGSSLVMVGQGGTLRVLVF